MFNDFSQERQNLLGGILSRGFQLPAVCIAYRSLARIEKHRYRNPTIKSDAQLLRKIEIPVKPSYIDMHEQ